MPRGALFDRVVVVDWSAASAPRRGRDSIWMATLDVGGRAVENLATRRTAERRIADLVDGGGGRRTLLGVDFSLGYPSGTAAALGLAGPPWRAMWALLEAEVSDGERNANNRFRVAAGLNRRAGDRPGPFWGRPPAQAVDGLSRTKPDGIELPEWRATERALRAHGRRPFSSWQLLGAGCVGSQSLLGIPVLERLRRGGGDRVHVWPFTTGLAVPQVAPGDLVVAEVWPSLVDIEAVDVEAVAGRHPVRDAVQVEVLAGHLADLDRRGLLAKLFNPAVDAAVAESVIAEEGWVLGATPVTAVAPAAMAGTGG